MAVDPRTPGPRRRRTVHRTHRRPRLPRHVCGRSGHRGRACRAGRHRGGRGHRRAGDRGVRRTAAIRDLHTLREATARLLGQLFAIGGTARRCRSGARGARAHRRQRPPEAGDGVRRGDRRRRHRGGVDPRLRARLHREVLRRPGRQAGLHRTRRRPARGSRLRLRAVHERVHRDAWADRRTRAVRTTGQRATCAIGSQLSTTTAGTWPSSSRRSPKSLPRTRFRPRR